MAISGTVLTEWEARDEASEGKNTWVTTNSETRPARMRSARWPDGELRSDEEPFERDGEGDWERAEDILEWEESPFELEVRRSSGVLRRYIRKTGFEALWQ